MISNRKARMPQGGSALGRERGRSALGRAVAAVFAVVATVIALVSWVAIRRYPAAVVRCIFAVFAVGTLYGCIVQHARTSWPSGESFSVEDAGAEPSVDG